MRKKGSSNSFGKLTPARPAQAVSVSGLGGDVLDDVADRLHLLSVLVRDVEVELFFHRHHELDDVEAVGAQVINEGGSQSDLLGLHRELVTDNVADSFFNGR